MSVSFFVEITPALVTKRRHGEIKREALRHAARNHVKNVLPKHFTKAGAQEYHYKRRNPKYVEKKLRQGYGDVPLVREGKLKKRIGGNARITATQNKSTVYLRSYFDLSDERRRELEALSGADIRTAQQAAIDYYAREAAKPENRRQRKRRIS